MTDQILKFIALATLIGFLSVIVLKVPEFDLIAVTVIVALMACWDFWISPKTKDEDD